MNANQELPSDASLVPRDTADAQAQQIQQLKQALAESEERFQLLSEATHDAFWDWDLRTRQITWSGAFRELFGYHPENLEPGIESWTTRIHPDDRERVESSILRAIDQGEANWMAEYRFRRADDSYTYVLDRGYCLLDAKGVAYRMVGSMQEITRQVHYRQQLEHNIAYVRAILDHIPQIAWTLRPDTFETDFFNQRWYAYTGLSTEASRHPHWNQVLHPEDMPRVLEKRHRSTRLGQAYSLECRLRRHDGQYRWQLIRVEPVTNGQGEISLWVGTATDMDELRRTTDQLAQNQARLQAIFEQTRVGIVITDLNFRFEYANERYCQMVGRSLPVLRELTMVDITHPDDLGGNLRQLQKTLEEDNSFAIEKRYLRPDGQVVWVTNHVSLIRNPAGEPEVFLGVCEDITDRKRAERALRESQQQFQTLAEAIPQLVWSTDGQGSVDYYNQGWYAYTGQSFEQSKGEGWAQCFHPDDLPNLFNYWQQALQSGQPYQTQARIRRADGAYRWFLIRALPMRDEHGQVVRWFGTDTDIDEHKQLEERLQEMTGQLARANDELRRINVDLDNFVYTASHDLRSPVNNLEGLQGLLLQRLEPKLDPGEQQLLQYMGTAVQKLKATLSDLSAIVRFEQALAHPLEPVLFEEIADEVITELSPMITQTGARLERYLTVPMIQYPRSHLRSIVYNLLSNALKYRAPERPPRIQISTGQEDDRVWLKVRDNGLGIPPEGHEKVFAVFKRVHTHVEGSGLGLYMIKRMVENQGGRIQLESQPGEGSTFTVYF